MAYDFEDALVVSVGSEYTPGAKSSIDYDGPPVSVVMAAEYSPSPKGAINYDPSISFGGGGSTTIISSALNPGIERAT